MTKKFAITAVFALLTAAPAHASTLTGLEYQVDLIYSSGNPNFCLSS
jgi:hypothetical protein